MLFTVEIGKNADSNLVKSKNSAYLRKVCLATSEFAFFGAWLQCRAPFYFPQKKVHRHINTEEKIFQEVFL